MLGSAATLRRSPVWAALLEDAEKRTKIVPDAAARSLTEGLLFKGDTCMHSLWPLHAHDAFR